ncbi:MAG: MMPL family transporter [Lachnospiraceae bacterium]|nr:MMPL family transporter [Lachnospiraceae bacterium]
MSLLKKNNNEGGKPDPMKLVATGIVNARFVILAVFAVVCVYCVLSIGKVKVNDDLTAFLPDTTETRKGLTIMEDEFLTYGTADVMISNITCQIAEDLADEIRGYEHVASVDFDDSPAHFTDSSALLSISFDGETDDPDVEAEMDHIKERLKDYDTYISSEIGYDFSAELAKEMVGVLLIAALVIVGVLLFTSRSYFEVVIFGIVFAVAALMNMGTNYWLGEISSITNSIAVILQLVLAIDYAIIFIHRYQDEVAKNPRVKEALIEALSKAILEISSSSLTTISGLIALTMMQFRLGYDMGIVLTKGIVCSLITVFLLMPGLIMLFPRQLRRTTHRNLIPSIRPWGKFLTRAKYCFVWVFIIILPFAIYYSRKTEYAFSDTSITEIVYSESREAMHRIRDTFADSNVIAVIVPSGEYENEKAILNTVSGMDHVRTATGLANIDVGGGHVLTDPFTPQMFAELLDLDYETSLLLFEGYGIKNEEYQVFFGNADEYRVILLNMFEYLFEKIDQGMVNLDRDKAQQIQDLREELHRGTMQLRGENYDRLIFNADVPVEGEVSLALTDAIRSEAEKYYGDGNVLVVGEITSARDLADSYTGDSKKISLLTIAFIFIILLFTFRTFAGAALLAFVIQGSIWINFTFPYFQGLIASFVTDMIVSAIQMGATIDYAIVIMNRYQSLKKETGKREAMIAAVDEGFATVITSGSILTMAGFMIGLRVSDVYVSHIGLAVGRGAAISVVLVMTVLPQFILLLDRLIDKTSFKLSLPKGDDDGQEDAAVPDPAGDIPAEAPKIPEISAEAVQTAEIPAEAPGTAEVQDDVYSEKSGEEVRQ